MRWSYILATCTDGSSVVLDLSDKVGIPSTSRERILSRRMAMKITLYLFRSEASRFEDLVQMASAKGIAQLEEVPVKAGIDLPFVGKAFIKTQPKDAPKWHSFVEDFFEFSEFSLETQTLGIILLIKVDGRFLAVTFGYVYHHLNQNMLEPLFGLKVALSDLATNSIRSVDASKPDTKPFQRKIHTNIGSQIPEFGVDPNREWIRRAEGRSSGIIQGTISGADSFSFNLNGLANLEGVCKAILKMYSDKGYQRKFPFVDHLRPLKPKEEIVTQLDAELLVMLQGTKADGQLAVADPDPFDYKTEELDHFVIKAGETEMVVSELTIDAIFEFFTRNPEVKRDYRAAIIYGVGSDGRDVTSRKRLKDYLVCQINKPASENVAHPKGGKSKAKAASTIYTHCFGNWFQISGDHSKQIIEAVQRIEDLTGKLTLPPFGLDDLGKIEGETPYNKRVATEKNWLLLDNVLWHRGNDKIEPCDLITKNREFIIVKKMESSAYMSHLFSQASVCSQLLAENNTEFTEWLAAKIRPYDTELADNLQNRNEITFVFAVQTPKPGPLTDVMFFFSLINLREHAKDLQMRGYKVAMCKIA